MAPSGTSSEGKGRGTEIGGPHPPVNSRSSSLIYKRHCPSLELYVGGGAETLLIEIIVIWIPTRLNLVQLLLNKSVWKQV